MKHCIIILSFILLSDYAISQEQTDSITTKKKGYHFGIMLFDVGIAHVQKLKQPDNSPIVYDSHFLVGGWLYFATLASLHNLHKNWDIGFKVGFFDIGKSNVDYWTSFSFATYGYYYPFEERYFIRFGLENNVPFDLHGKEGHGTTNQRYGEFPGVWGVWYENKFNFRTSLSLGVGLNLNNDNYLLHLAISVPLYNKYGYHRVWQGGSSSLPPIGDYPVKLYYVITGGFTWLFI